MSQRTKLPILLVDDDEATRQLLTALMMRFGFASQMAINGQQALDLLASHEYGAIVLDLMMPSVGGHDVISYLKASGRRTPVIVCTAAGRAAVTGFDTDIVKAVVRKPFDIDHFITIVKQLMAGSEPDPPAS